MTAPTVDVKFRAVGVGDVQRSLKLVGDAGTGTLNRVGSASRQVAGGIEAIARQGKFTGEALKQVIAQGAEMAFLFGAAGPIVGAIGIVGLSIYEHITNRMKEAREEINKTRKEFEGLSDLAAAGRAQQFRFSGNPNAIRLEGESNAEFIARRFGIEGVRSRIEELRGQLPAKIVERAGRGKLPEGLVATPISEAAKELIGLLEQLTKLKNELTQLTPITQKLADAEGERAKNAVKLADEEAIKNLPLSLSAIERDNAMTARLNAAGVNGLTIPGVQRMALGGQFTTTRLGGAEGARGFGIQAPEVKLFLSDKTADFLNGIKSMAEQVQGAIANGLGDAISAGFDAAFAKGGNVGKGIAAFAGAVGKTIGGVFKQIGTQSLLGLSFMQKIKDAIIAFSPGLGITAAIGLIAFGSALQAGGDRAIQNASGGGSRSISASGYSGGVTNAPIVVNPVGSIANLAGVRAVSPTVINATIIGSPNDPVVQRGVNNLVDRSRRRTF